MTSIPGLNTGECEEHEQDRDGGRGHKGGQAATAESVAQPMESGRPALPRKGRSQNVHPPTHTLKEIKELPLKNQVDVSSYVNPYYCDLLDINIANVMKPQYQKYI